MDFNNMALDYYKGEGIAQDKINNIANKISKMFYPAPTNTDIADTLYRGYGGQASNIIEMSPDEYLRQSYNTYHYGQPTSEISEPYDKFLKKIERQTLSGDTSGGNLLDKIKRGQKLDMLELTYDESGKGLGQEGNHRAMAAKLAGENKVPVAITTYSGKKGLQDAAKKNLLKSLRFGGKVLMGLDPWFAVTDMLKLQGQYPYSQKEYKQILNDMGIQYNNGKFQI